MIGASLASGSPWISRLPHQSQSNYFIKHMRIFFRPLGGRDFGEKKKKLMKLNSVELLNLSGDVQCPLLHYACIRGGCLAMPQDIQNGSHNLCLLN